MDFRITAVTPPPTSPKGIVHRLLTGIITFVAMSRIMLLNRETYCPLRALITLPPPGDLHWRFATRMEEVAMNSQLILLPVTSIEARVENKWPVSARTPMR
jgi:hypothetical protein